VLFVTGIFKRSGVCCMCQEYLSGVVRIVCDRDV